MARLIGMDEAGLGPNLGPFVVAVTVWDIPGSPFEFDFWKTFEDVLTNSPTAHDTRLHVADSKEVFQPKRGFDALERGVLAALRMNGLEPQSYEQLCQFLSADNTQADAVAEIPPWYRDHPLELPTEPIEDRIGDAWLAAC